MPKRKQASRLQVSLWDRLTRKAPVAAPVTVPLSAANWPDRETMVVVSGDPEQRPFAVIGRMDCGRDLGRVDAYALVVPFEGRFDPGFVPRGVILIDRLEVAPWTA
jgi:hypothetical protein